MRLFRTKNTTTSIKYHLLSACLLAAISMSAQFTPKKVVYSQDKEAKDGKGYIEAAGAGGYAVIIKQESKGGFFLQSMELSTMTQKAFKEADVQVEGKNVSVECIVYFQNKLLLVTAAQENDAGTAELALRTVDPVTLELGPPTMVTTIQIKVPKMPIGRKTGVLLGIKPHISANGDYLLLAGHEIRRIVVSEAQQYGHVCGAAAAVDKDLKLLWSTNDGGNPENKPKGAVIANDGTGYIIYTSFGPRPMNVDAKKNADDVSMIRVCRMSSSGQTLIEKSLGSDFGAWNGGISVRPDGSAICSGYFGGPKSNDGEVSGQFVGIVEAKGSAFASFETMDVIADPKGKPRKNIEVKQVFTTDDGNTVVVGEKFGEDFIVTWLGKNGETLSSTGIVRRGGSIPDAMATKTMMIDGQVFILHNDSEENIANRAAGGKISPPKNAKPAFILLNSDGTTKEIQPPVEGDGGSVFILRLTQIGQNTLFSGSLKGMANMPVRIDL